MLIERVLIEKWETLKKKQQITVKKNSNLLCSLEQIEKAESELKFKFPQGYKEFCLVFGAGSFGIGEFHSEFRINCPTCPQTDFDIRETGHMLIGLEIDLEASGLNKIEAALPHRLLEKGWAFADTPSADSFFWDLTSYREDDKSYDIYLKRDEDVEEIKLVGRDFYEFVSDFCLGSGLKILYDDSDLINTSLTGEKLFTAYEIYKEPYGEQAKLFLNLSLEDWIKTIDKYPSKTVSLIFSYIAPNQEKAECLINAWHKFSVVDVEVTAGNDRSITPRIIEVTLQKTPMTKDFAMTIFEKILQIESECECQIASFGSDIK